MTKKEKAILKLAQKWAKARAPRGKSYDTFIEADVLRCCGRALLKILEP